MTEEVLKPIASQHYKILQLAEFSPQKKVYVMHVYSHFPQPLSCSDFGE